jgi:hypothetical protein
MSVGRKPTWPAIGRRAMGSSLARGRGRYRPDGQPGRYNNVTTTLSDEEYARLLAWIDNQPDPKPTRSDAMRGFILAGLGILARLE